MSPGTVKKVERPPLRLGPFIMGGAGFSHQLVSDPHQAPAVDILETAFQAGVRTIDTSPYYDPSEMILGAALSHPRITTKYRREDYVLMTKAGRIAADHFDYSPEWIRKSVSRSLERFQTSYLDVVFCHDVEFVSLREAVEAVGALFQLAEEGIIGHVGISGYDINVLSRVASAVLKTYSHPVDVVQTWAQLTLQNTRLETCGLDMMKNAGVKTICASSPLAIGLLSSRGVPIGGLGDWHPAPKGLRVEAKKAADEVAISNDSISSLALRYAIRKAMALSTPELQISTISGVASLTEITENIATARQVLGNRLERIIDEDYFDSAMGDTVLEEKDRARCTTVRKILGSWVDYDFSQPTKRTDSPHDE